MRSDADLRENRGRRSAEIWEVVRIRETNKAALSRYCMGCHWWRRSGVTRMYAQFGGWRTLAVAEAKREVGRNCEEVK